MDLLIANIPFLIAVVYLVVLMIASYKRGFAKELCSLVALFVATIAVMLIAFALRAYFDQERIMFVITIILLFLLFVLYKIVDMFLTGIKIISKLPIVRIVDKPLGVIVGLAEFVLTLWAVYCVVLVFDAGAFERIMIQCVNVNPIMRFAYEYNYMYMLTEMIFNAIRSFNLWEKLGM